MDTLGEHVYRYHDRMDEYWFNVPPGRSENDIGEQLIATGYYRYVCPNWWSAPSSAFTGTEMLNDCPDDPLLDNQWHLKRIEACAGWQIQTQGHDDVVVAISDMGMRVDHEDLSNLNEYRREGYDGSNRLWESNGGNISETGSIYCHGSVVLGSAAATGDNGKGVSGIGWSLRHRMLTNGNGVLDDVLNTLWVAAVAGDRVISSSSGDDFRNHDGVWQIWADNTYAIRHEAAYDVLIIHSGQNKREWVYEPFPDMIMVGGTNQQDTRWIVDEEWGSAVGAFIDVMAPAQAIYSTKCGSSSAYGLNGGFAGSGTSFAAPQVAGLCALIWSYDPDLTASEVGALLYAGCDETADYDPDLHGHGRINVFNSLALASGELWTRDPHPGVAGEDNTFKAAGAEAGRTIRFYYGTQTGETQVSGCGGTVVVGIANASILGTAVAGSNGAALLEDMFVPGGWANTTVYFQAVELTTCRVSNVVYTSAKLMSYLRRYPTCRFPFARSRLSC